MQKSKGELNVLPEAGLVQHDVEDEYEADDVPIDVLKDCVINMFRQASLRSIPALSGYLEEFYAEIPACMRIPIIVSAYTAAQKVALTHDDIKDGQDVERAKQSMARWRHGLSAIAPTKERGRRSTASSRSSSMSSLRCGQRPSHTVTCSTPLSRCSSISDVISPRATMAENSFVVPGREMAPLATNVSPAEEGPGEDQPPRQSTVVTVESQHILPSEHNSEDDPITANCDTATDVAVKPARGDILAEAMREILSPVGEQKKVQRGRCKKEECSQTVSTGRYM